MDSPSTRNSTSTDLKRFYRNSVPFESPHLFSMQPKKSSSQQILELGFLIFSLKNTILIRSQLIHMRKPEMCLPYILRFQSSKRIPINQNQGHVASRFLRISLSLKLTCPPEIKAIRKETYRLPTTVFEVLTRCWFQGGFFHNDLQFAHGLFFFYLRG